MEASRACRPISGAVPATTLKVARAAADKSPCMPTPPASPPRPRSPRAGVAIPLAVALVSVSALVYAGMSEVDPLLTLLAGISALAMVVWLGWSGADGRSQDRGRRRSRDDEALADLAAELERRLSAPDPAPTLFLRFDLHGFKAYNDDFGREAGNALLARLEEKLVAVVPTDGRAFRLTGDEFCLVAPVGEGDAEELIERGSAALSLHGDGFRIGCSFGGVLVPFEAADPEAVLRLADERLASHRRSKQNARSMNALAAALSERGETRALTGRVESLAVAVGGLLGIHGDRLDALSRAAELSEVGRLSIPREILDKPWTLAEDEWEFVRQQTLIAERAVRTSPQLSSVAPIVRATCENWDGSGYPDGRAGEDIQLAARIIRVCNAYDAMLSPRAYREALSPEEALAELEARAGTTFDPAVVRVLAALVDAGRGQRRAA